MPMKLSIIPKDSYLRDWMLALSGLETPRSYLLLVALSAVGSLLRRNVWIDQVHWNVWPNLSCFLVGPSGIGKDTAINKSMALVRSFGGNIVQGRTVEKQAERMVETDEDPSCWMVPGKEAADFFGKKDYQLGKLEFYTALLGTDEDYDHSSKKDGILTIKNPTISMQLGSTAAWIQHNMPAGTLEGGFFPRFVVINEDYSARQVPWIKYGSTKQELIEWKEAMDRFYTNVGEMLAKYNQHPREMVPRQEALDYYTNWYCNRFNYFDPGVREYANRSRDQLLRIAMICATLRGRTYMDKEDCVFAHNLLTYAASTLEEAIRPQSTEQQCQEAYQQIIRQKGPQPRFAILALLRKSYDHTTISKAETQLVQSHIICKKKDSKNMELVNE